MAARNKPAGKTQAERDAKSLGMIESFLDKALEGKCVCVSCKKEFDIKDLHPNVLKAIQLRYDKLRPALSAVEQTTLNPEDKKTEEQIINDLRALIKGNADLVRLLLEEGKSCGVNPENAAQHVDNPESPVIRH